jgi:NADH-quinone oxidoreductase subunit D
MMQPNFPRESAASQRSSSRSEALVGGARLDLNRAPQHRKFGPHHPGTRAALGLTAELDGERILSLEVEIGYGHRGFEIQAQGSRWHQVVPHVERLQTKSSMSVATAYCLGVERLLEMEVPLRASWLRALGCELGRGADHLARIASLARLLGAPAPASWALMAGERLRELLELLSGAPSMHHYVRIGGVAAPLPPGFGDLARTGMRQVRFDLEDVDVALGQNRIFVDRLRGRAKLSAEQCLAMGVTGPLLRAAGVASDLRRSEPYLVYDELVFDLPIGLVGDNLDRYRVCVEEIRQSLSMAEQCLLRIEALGPGETCSGNPWLQRREGPGDPGSLTDRIAEASAYVQGPSVPAGEAWARVEAANGELGFCLVADGGKTPRRVRCRAPSFFHAQALSAMLTGETLSEIGPTLVLANIEGAECDR